MSLRPLVVITGLSGVIFRVRELTKIPKLDTANIKAATTKRDRDQDRFAETEGDIFAAGLLTPMLR
jgi:hypothetical protein